MDEERIFQNELRSQMFRNSFAAQRGERSAVARQSDLTQQLGQSVQGGLQRRAEESENRKRRQLEYSRPATDAGLRRRDLDMRAASLRQQPSVLAPRTSALLSNEEEQ